MNINIVEKRLSEAKDHSLNFLDLSRLNITRLPPQIWELSDLERVNLSNNKLDTLPSEIGKLKNLTELRIECNRLVNLPNEVGSLKNLRSLILYKNRLQKLPKSIGSLSKLEELKLHNNQISELPNEIGYLSNLRSLYVNHNELNGLPPSLGKLKNISLIRIDGNHMPDSLKAAYNRGTKELLTYLLSLYEDSTQLYEAKIILVGEGAVGKSSLIAAMEGKEFIEHRETTHGIEIGQLKLPHPSLDEELTLHIWDFGGQPVYRTTHQFFYSKRSLYLLLWTPRRGVELCDVEGWIKRVRLRIGDEAKIIIVATHCETDKRVIRIDKQSYMRDYGKIIFDFHEVDNKTGFGIESLKEKIALASSRLPQMGDILSTKWKDARDKILLLNRPNISYSFYEKICRGCGLGEEAMDTLADLMHDLGYIVYFGDDNDLKNEIVLVPEWLTKAISFVLEDPKTNQEAGVLEHSSLTKIWRDHGIEGREKYDIKLHPFFLRLMEKYDVSYRLEGGNNSLVAQLVPNESPDLPWLYEDSVEEGEVEVRLVCQMNEQPPGLIPWMTVRTHHFSTRPRLHWQKGIFLEYPGHGAALLELRDRELFVVVRAAWPNYFLSILQYTLECLISERWPGLDATFSVPCPERAKDGKPCRGSFPLQTLYKIRKTFNQLPCMTCSSVISVEGLLTGFSSPDIRETLGKIEKGVEHTQKQLAQIASTNAARFGILMRSLAEETRECPRLFTLFPVEENKWNPYFLGKIEFQLTLWCEMPDCQHPLCKIGSGGEGEYIFRRSKDWFLRIAPYVSLIAKTLKSIVPIVGASIKLIMNEAILEDTKKKYI